MANRFAFSVTNNFFFLFGLPERFALDGEALERAYRALQSKVHPDRYAAAPEAERRAAMQWAAHANEAYSVLRNPLRRAIYLCEQRGAPVRAESNTEMPDEFLLQQMQWREALDEAINPLDWERVQALLDEVQAQRAAVQTEFAAAVDEQGDMSLAVGLARQWMFLERMGQEVQRAMHAADDPRSGS